MAGKSLLSLDQFSETFTMNLDKKSQTLQTFTGAFCSLLMIIIVGLYAYQKSFIWLNKKDVDILSSTQS